MEKESEKLNYEKAAILRDRIKSLTYIQSSQNIQKNNLKDADLIVSFRKENVTCIVIFFIVQNKIGVVNIFIQNTITKIVISIS